MKHLDQKLANIRAGSYTPGRFHHRRRQGRRHRLRPRRAGARSATSPTRFTPRATHLQDIRDMTKSGLVDIMLMSASTGERLSKEGLFEGSAVTPAIRLNDTTDIWSARGGRYKEEPSRHHRTARRRPGAQVRRSRPLLGHLLQPARHRRRERRGLHGVPRRGRRTRHAALPRGLQSGLRHPARRRRRHGRLHQRQHRAHARRRDGRRPSEVPQAPVQRPARHGGTRLLRSRPPDRRHPRRRRRARRATPSSCFSQAEKYGARVALFGRKIHLAESPIEIVRMMREVVAAHRHAGGGGQGLSRRAAEAEDQAGPLARRRFRAHRGAAEAAA